MSRRRQRKSAFSLFAFQDIITAVTGIMLLITLLLTLELVERKAKASQETPATVPKDADVSPEELSQLELEVANLKKRLKEMASENAMLAQYDQQQLQADLQKNQKTNQERQEKIRNLQKTLVSTATSLENVRNTQAKLQQLEEKIRNTRAKLEKLQKSSRLFVQAAKGARKTNWLVEISKEKLKVAPLGRTTTPISFTDVYDFQAWLRKRNQAADHFVLFVKAEGTSLFKQVSGLLDKEGYSKGFDVLPDSEHVIDDTTGAGIP